MTDTTDTNEPGKCPVCHRKYEALVESQVRCSQCNTLLLLSNGNAEVLNRKELLKITIIRFAAPIAVASLPIYYPKPSGLTYGFRNVAIGVLLWFLLELANGLRIGAITIKSSTVYRADNPIAFRIAFLVLLAGVAMCTWFLYNE